ncbi:helix-turn-helix domain-containing protein [Actinomycetospora sp. CA-101289]|uniref:helix-turn-helix domain-containing protein n=1 Tax=Actinomycetospora sp. CA-101289 TaxID=3239893 RepID=UPI003D99870C
MTGSKRRTPDAAELEKITAMRAELRSTVRDAMARQGMTTYAALSERSGVSRAQVSKYLAEPKDYHPRRLSWNVIAKLFEALEVDPTEFVDRHRDVLDVDAPPAPPAVPPSRPRPWTLRRTRWRPGVVAAVVGALLVVVAAGTAVWWSTGEGSTALPSSTERPSFTEDFTEAGLDPVRWQLPSDPVHLFPRDRRLNVIGSPGPDQEIETTLRPRDAGPFRELDFVMSALAHDVPGPGGVDVTVTERSGRTHQIVFGPSPGPIPLLAAVLVCSRPVCASYDDYDPPPPTRLTEQFVRGEVVPIKIVQDGSTLTFWMRDAVIGEAQVDEPLADFAIHAYASPGESWHVTVDAVRVYR